MNRGEILKVITGTSSKRDRQVQVGPSEIGGCRRKVWHRLNGTPNLNVTLRLPALMGTAIHHMIEKQLDDLDPFNTRYLRELEVEHDGFMGHVDCYDTVEKMVIDWKTTTKKNISKFPSSQQRTQVHLYGWLLEKNGYEVLDVTLVAIPRDGNENNIVVHTEPYDRRFAEHGLNWLESVKNMTEAPEPEMPARTFCQSYCQFYDPTGEKGCTGK
jgi:hypothetical protein